MAAHWRRADAVKVGRRSNTRRELEQQRRGIEGDFRAAANWQPEPEQAPERNRRRRSRCRRSQRQSRPGCRRSRLRSLRLRTRRWSALARVSTRWPRGAHGEGDHEVLMTRQAVQLWAASARFAALER
jgi:hypothetical protein